MIEFKKTSLNIGHRKILKNVNFKIEDGSFTIITGDSGAGKTSLIKLLLGALKPTSGDVLINNIAINKLKPSLIQTLRRNIGVVFQDSKLIPSKSVYENILFPLQVLGVNEQTSNKQVTKLLKAFSLTHIKNQLPSTLSGGEMQRVALARAIVNNPMTLIADEPTGNLDEKNTIVMVDLFKQINKNNKSIILTTHDKNLIKQFPNANIINLSN